MKLSEHFTLEELTFSQTAERRNNEDGIINIADLEHFKQKAKTKVTYSLSCWSAQQ